MSAVSKSLLGEHVVAARPDGVSFANFAYPGSVVLLPTGSLLAVFTGSAATGPCVALGVRSNDGGKTWSAPAVLFGGDQVSDSTVDLAESYADPNIVIVSDKRVLAFCVSLRYDEKVWDLSRTRCWRRISEDGGKTFGPVQEIPRHKKYCVGTVHPGMRLRNGTVVMGYSWERSAQAGRPASGEGTMDCVAGVLISRDEGISWQGGGDCCTDMRRAEDALPYAANGLDEPAIVELSNGDLFLLARTATHTLWQSFSRDGGLRWETPTPSPLTSHNCPAALLRLSGDHGVMVVYNNHPQQRLKLSVAVSKDGCCTWSDPRCIGPIGDVSEKAEASYPNACQLPDGTIVVVFGQIDRGDPNSRFSIYAVRLSPDMLGA